MRYAKTVVIAVVNASVKKFAQKIVNAVVMTNATVKKIATVKSVIVQRKNAIAVQTKNKISKRKITRKTEKTNKNYGFPLC